MEEMHATRIRPSEGKGVMWLSMVGVNYMTAPVEVREKIGFSKEEIPTALAILCAKDDVLEAIILSTCNRVEIYALLTVRRPRMLSNFIQDFHKYPEPLTEYLYFHEGEDVIVHLCRVASGMESMVTGESQVFGQVKDAYRTALDIGSAGRGFEMLFSRAFGVVKRVRAKSGIGEQHVSIAYMAVSVATGILGDLSQSKVMVLGAGEMGEITARDLKSRGVKDILVVNRTFQKAVQLAERFNGTPIMLHEMEEYLPSVDILISSVGADHHLVTLKRIENLFETGRENVLLIIDIAVPRSVDPEVGAVNGVRLINIDELQGEAEKGAVAREQAMRKASEMIRARTPEIMEIVRTSDLIPTIASIRQKAEEIRKRGLDEAVDKLSISPTDRETVDIITKSIVNKVLRHSEVKFREYSSRLKR